LARGAVRANFGPSGTRMSQEQWDAQFGNDPVQKAEYILKCPVHGEFASGKQFFLKGDYPLGPDEHKVGKCLAEDCYEIAVYAGFQPIGGVETSKTVPEPEFVEAPKLPEDGLPF